MSAIKLSDAIASAVDQLREAGASNEDKLLATCRRILARDPPEREMITMLALWLHVGDMLREQVDSELLQALIEVPLYEGEGAR